MKIFKILLLFLFPFIFSSCMKEGPVGPEGPAGQNGNGDKQVRFDLGNLISYGDTSIASLDNSPCGIHQFNIGNYTGVDSAVFVIYNVATAASCCGGPDIAYNARFEIFDLTNNQPVVNSEILSDDIPTGTFAVSKNFVKNLPGETIDLGVRIITGKNIFTTTGKVYLFLYRK